MTQFFAVVKFGGAIFDFFRDQIADTAQFFVAVRVGGLPFKNHFATFEHGSFGNQRHGIVAGVFAAVGDQQFGELVNVEFVLGNDAAVCGSGERGQHGGVAGVTAENFENQKAFVGAGRSANAVGQLNGAGNAGAESDAVIGTGDVVVHGLGNGHHVDAFLVQTHAVAERVIAADGDHVVHAKPFEIFEDFGSEIVFSAAYCDLRCSGTLDLLVRPGLVREEWRKVPPVRLARLTTSSVRN
jgi:hypothetical protein